MTLEEAIKRLGGILTEAVEFENSVCYVTEEDREPLEMAIKALEQEHCDDEYIKIPKKALKYRTAGMVAYNAEWLKNHFDIERAVILECEYKEQEPFINKPCVSSGVCEHDKNKILDKIRAEIAEYKDDKIIHAERNEMIDIVLDIIDKYKSEIEPQERSRKNDSKGELRNERM